MLEGTDGTHGGPCSSRHGFFHLERRFRDSTLRERLAGRFDVFLGDCSDTILELAGQGRVVALVLGGSLATGEGSVAFRSGRPLFLSDIDFLVVAGDVSAHSCIYPRRAEIGEACENLFPEAEFMGRVDVGVLVPEELGGLPRSPGVYDMRHAGRVLNGDGSVIELIPDFHPSAIGPHEALRLLENRMAAFLGDWPGEDGPADEGRTLGFLYSLCRVYTDILTAALVCDGRYEPGYEARYREVSCGGERTPEGLDEEIIGKIGAWTRFKLEPSIEGATLIKAGQAGTWLEAATDISDFRKAVASRISSDKDARENGSPLGTIRSWKVFLGSMSLADAARVLAGRLPSLPGRDPLRVVRDEAVRLLDLAVEGGSGKDVGGCPGGFPYSGGTWGEAARELNAAWKRLVFGR